MKFRQAIPSDMPRLLECEQGVVEAERPFNDSIKSSGVRYYDLEYLMSDRDSLLGVVEIDGLIVGTGYAQLRDSKASYTHLKHGYLGFIYVAPDFRGRGIAQNVMENLLSWGRSEGVSDFYLDVYSQNESAIKAYQKAGFRPGLLEMKLSE